MMNVKDGRKRSVFYRYIVFGLLVIMVPCFLLIGVWTRERYVEQERQLMDEENLLLIQMMENVENGVDDLREISQQIMLDKEISPYRLRKGNYYTVEALNKLELYCKGTNIFEDLMICLNAEQEIYRTDGKETTGMKLAVAAQLEVMRDCKEVGDFFVSFRSCIGMLLEYNSAPGRKGMSDKMQKIKEFIDANYQLPQMSLSYMAEQFGIRDSYLSKLFKENMGENSIDYLLQKRLEEAARLLRETDMTVKQVVKSVGYEDATSFAKKFSKRFGMTPGVLRINSRGFL